MAQLLIRDIDPSTLKRLKQSAKLHKRSLQGELKSIVETATKITMAEARVKSKAWHKRLSGRAFNDSAALLREDRNR